MQTSRQHKELYALYYPETICLHEQELKYFLLLYDKVFFLPIDIQLNPGHTKLSQRFSIHDATLTGAFKSRRDAHYALMYMSESKIWDDYMKRLMALYDELEEKGILVGLSDQAFANASAWHPLRGPVDVDLRDPLFISLCQRYQNPKIFIPRTEGAVIKGGGFLTRPFAYKKDFAIPSICAERLNSTLFFAECKKLFPVSTGQMYVDLLSAKLKRIAEYEKGQSTPEAKSTRTFHKISMLSWEVATEAVPYDVINRKTPKDILRYKAACAELKGRFHSHLLSLEASINSEPWDKSFGDELDRLVKKELLPEIQRVRDKKSMIWEKLFGDSLKSISSLKVLPPLLGLHLIPGISCGEILSLSSGIIGGAMLPGLITAWEEQKQLRRNALFFIVNFNKKA